MNLTVFWFLFFATLTFALREIIPAVIHRRDLLGFGMLASGMWLYFYGFMAYDVITYMQDYIPDHAANMGQFVAFICLLGLLAGWRWGLRRRVAPEPEDARRVNPGRIWVAGGVLMTIGIIGQYTFFGQTNIDFKNSSSYWYLLFYLNYPGLSLCIIAMAIGSRQRTVAHWITLTGLTVAAMYPHIIQARRGPLFPMLLIIGYLPYLAKRKQPSRFMILGLLTMTGLLMLAFLLIRPSLGEGSYRTLGQISETNLASRWKDSWQDLSLTAVLFTRAEESDDNEYLYHCAAIETIRETGRYQYGTGYLTLLTHWIPRQWWQDKPSLNEGFFPSAYDVLPSVMGWSMTTGASSGGAANTFEEFGLFCPIFWMALGAGAARLYSLAVSRDRPHEKAYYVAFLCASHWLISQGFAAAFVPACFFVIPQVLAFHWATTRRSPDRRSFRRPQPQS